MSVNLGELDNAICIQCGKKAYEYKGKVYKLCAECGWEALVTLAGCVDDDTKTVEEKVTEVVEENGNN